MKKSTKWMGFAGIVLACHLCLAACQQTNGGKTKEQSQIESSVTIPDEELIVVSEIRENSYMRLQGEESYLVDGPVPYGAKFLESTLVTDDYQLKKSDIQYELEQGYIVEINEQYFYYPKSKGANVLSLKEAQNLTKGQKKSSAKTKEGVAGVDFPTDDGFLFKNEEQILTKTDEGLVLEHDGHSHFIFYKDLVNTKWSYLVPGHEKTRGENSQPALQSTHHSQQFDDGYVFDPKDIVAEDANGYTVRHGDHFHYIWKSSLNQTSLHETKTLLASSETNHSRSTEHWETPQQNLQKKMRFPGIDYPTSDGFLFDGSGVEGQTSLGLLIRHHEHTHLIPYDHLVGSRWEHYIPQRGIKVVPNITIKKNEPSSSPTVEISHKNNSETSENSKTPEQIELEKKQAYLAQLLGVAVERIQLIETPQGLSFVYPHGDHAHTILVDKVEVGKPIDDPHGDPHAHDKIGMETLKKIGFDDDIIDDILHATADEPFPSMETNPEKMKEWFKTVKYLNIGQRKDPLKRKGLDLMPNIEVLGIGFTPIDDITPVFQFKHLKQLWMTKTGVKDYRFLARLPQLEGIDLSQNGVSDLSFLQDYPQLKVVSAAGNELKDIRVLAGLKALESLNLDHNQISDLSPLSGLEHLTAVSLENNHLSDLSALQNKEKLTRLYLSQNPELDLSTLKTEHLEELTANESNVDNLQFLENNQNLTSLTLKGNKLTDLKGLEKSEKLRNLDVEDNQIQTLELEGEQKSVEQLNVANNQLKNLEGIDDYKSLEVINASKNELETLAIETENTSLKTMDVSDNHIPEKELTANNDGIPVAIAEHFPSVEGGNIAGNRPKEAETIVEKQD